jgi:hypothetical protein
VFFQPQLHLRDNLGNLEKVAKGFEGLLKAIPRNKAIDLAHEN